MKEVLGAIAGDIIGSPFEANNFKSTEFYPLFQTGCCFTDDSVLTIATADKLLYGGNYADVYQHYARRHPHAGYGGNFFRWSQMREPHPYNSWGNGSGMRSSPIGWAFDSIEEVLDEAKNSAAVTHSHPEGIKGSQAIALAVFLSRTGHSKEEIRTELSERFEYNLDRTLDEIRPGYFFDVSCQGSVPESILAFLESTDFESAVRLAVSIGGDSDTIACMAGAVAHAYYQSIPDYIVEISRGHLSRDLEAVLNEFCDKYIS